MNINSFVIIITLSIITLSSRVLPFILFDKKKPSPFIQYMGKYLPFALMGMLVIYALKDTSFAQGYWAIPELVAVVVVIITYQLKKNTFISILSGTLLYMFLIQIVF